jgi:hypothetical protein
MKKIRLKNLKLEVSEMLGRNQLKTVLGGGHSSHCSCGNQCPEVGKKCTVNGKTGTCKVGHCDGCRTRMCYA